MIKRKRKRNPKKRIYRKRNPEFGKGNRKNIDDYFIQLLVDTIRLGSPTHLAQTLIYYNQGYMCDDCNKTYHSCQCEKCEECEYNRCMCDLDITTETFSDDYDLNRDKIVTTTWKFAKNVLNENQLELLYEQLLKSLKLHKKKYREHILSLLD